MRRRNSTDDEFRKLERAWRTGDREALAGIAAMNLRGQVSVEQVAALTGAATPRRALAEAEYLLVEGWHKLDTPPARDAFRDLARSRDHFDRWLATVIRRKIISKTWAIMACEATKTPWPAAMFEPGGYGFDELRPTDDSEEGSYVEPHIAYVREGKIDSVVRLMGPFIHPARRGRDPYASIEETEVSYPEEVTDYITEGMIKSCDLETVADDRGFDSVEEWIKSNLDEKNPIEDRAQFLASIWFDIMHYGGTPGDSENHTWDVIERRYTLSIAWEDAGWLT